MTLMLSLADISADTWSKPITAEPQVVGRARTADIHLESRFVSKAHCKFWMENGECIVEDCGSTNGTYMGGERIQRASLKSGDRVLVGNFELLIADDAQMRPTDYELPSSTTLFDQSMVIPPDQLPGKRGQLDSGDEERRLAAAVHQRLTPSRRIGLPGMLIEVAYLPSGLLGGDCFECIELGDRYVLAMFDAMNHGNKAALTVMLIRDELKRWVSLTHEPGKCLARLNAELAKLRIRDLYICGALAMWFPTTSSLVYATAGQHPPLWVRGNDVKNRAETAGGLPLGVLEGETYEEKLLQLRPKDRVYFFSDGLGDALDRIGHTGSSTIDVADSLRTMKSDGVRQLTSRFKAMRHSEVLDDAMLVACEVGELPAPA
jgi:hypothetical protein